MSDTSLPPVDFNKRRHRSVAGAVTNGIRSRCPSCGEPGLFASFLTTEEKCDRCSTEFHHHRADDLPAYLVVLVLGHLMVGLVILMQEVTNLGIWQQLSVVAPVSVVVAIFLLRPVKGAVIGLQWALYMHGFGGSDDGELETRKKMQE